MIAGPAKMPADGFEGFLMLAREVRAVGLTSWGKP